MNAFSERTRHACAIRIFLPQSLPQPKDVDKLEVGQAEID